MEKEQLKSCRSIKVHIPRRDPYKIYAVDLGLCRCELLLTLGSTVVNITLSVFTTPGSPYLAFSFVLDIGCKARLSVMQTGGRDILPMRGLRVKIQSGQLPSLPPQSWPLYIVKWYPKKAPVLTPRFIMNSARC
jgi:hypothetical protein